MNTTIVKLQLPINSQLRDALASKAAQLGFDSSQALLRYMAKAVVDDRRVTFGENDSDDWGEPSSEALARYERMSAEIEQERAAGTLKSFSTVEEFMADLRA